MMKKRILIIVYALLLCVTASFAWLSNFQATKVKGVKVEYTNGDLTVLDLAFDAELRVPEINGYNSDGSPIQTWKPVDSATKHIFDSTKVVPGSITAFRLAIKNKSDEAKDARLSLVFTIASEDVDLLDYLYIDTIAGTGFSTSNSYHKFIKLSDAEQVSSKDGVDEYIVRIYSYSDEITIPKSNNFVELDCSFYFDQEATAELQAKTIKTMAFRLE